MSSSEVLMRVNSSYDDWYGARAVVEEELKAIGKALEKIRISSQLQDAFTRHLLAVHHQWCEACPPSREPGLPAGGLEKESPTAAALTTLFHTGAAAAHSHRPMKQKTSVSDSCLSTFTQTTDIIHGPQMNAQDEVDYNNDDDISETSVPSAMTCHVEDEESQADVNRTLEKPSNEKVASTKFIKLEVLEDEFPDTLLKLEKDHCDVDMESSKEETPSQQIHEDEVPSQLIKSGGPSQSHLEKTFTVSDHLISHERFSQGHCDFDMAGSSSEAMSHQGPVEEIAVHRSDGTNNTISALSGDVLSQEGVCKDPCLDSYKKVSNTSRTDDGTNNFELDYDVPSAKGISTDQCPASLNSYKKVQKISRTDGKMKYQCSDCNVSYSHMNAYQKHLSTHTCQKAYQCSVCSKRFSRKDSFDTHLITHKGDTGKPFKCDHCSYQCSTKRTLNAHLRRHRGGMPCKCSFCGKMFWSKEAMNYHMSTHGGEKRFSCNICDFWCSQKGQLTVHMRLHTEDKPHHCSVCGKRFTQSSNLKKHMRTHSGQKPHQCSLCGSRFIQSGNLKRHMRVHTGQKPHQCSLCGSRFAHSHGLKRHMIIHTGQKPHQCSLCGKRYARLDYFEKHACMKAR